jgi:hypothetical protein
MTLRDLSMHDLICIARHHREAATNNPRLLATIDWMRAENAALAQAIIDDPTSSVGARALANEVLSRKRIERC